MPVKNCVFCKENPVSKDKKIYPFCSDRCKLLDLGAWANETYRVEGNSCETELEEGAEESPTDTSLLQ